MAQVNSTPGQNQTFANVAVVASAPAVGAQATRATAAAVAVPYAQNEGAKTPGERNPLRS